MTIDINEIKRLRDTTLAGIAHCKEALEETNGNFEEAVDLLKKKGLLIASKKSGRETSEGLIGVMTHNGKFGVIMEINSETDFVAKNDKFVTLARNIMDVACSQHISDLEEIKQANIDGNSVEEEINQHIAIIGENIQLSKISSLTVNNGVIASYVHTSISAGLGKKAAMVALESTSHDKEKLEALGKKIAMHIVASKPLAISVDQLDQDLVEKERSLIKEQLSSSDKPENVQEKIIEGKINKYYSNVVLFNQPFAMDDKITIKELLEQYSQDNIQISDYKLFILGEK